MHLIPQFMLCHLWHFCHRARVGGEGDIHIAEDLISRVQDGPAQISKCDLLGNILKSLFKARHKKMVTINKPDNTKLIPPPTLATQGHQPL